MTRTLEIASARINQTIHVHAQSHRRRDLVDKTDGQERLVLIGCECGWVAWADPRWDYPTLWLVLRCRAAQARLAKREDEG